MFVAWNARLVSVLVVLCLFVPAIPSPPAAGGSVWMVSGPSLQNGTVVNVTPVAQGIRLPCDQARLNNWTRLDPWPTPRTSSTMVYDSNDDVVILFGGYELTEVRNDTWVYNLSTNTWTQMHPKVSPSGRSSQSMAYDSQNGVVVLYGGAGVYKAETWTYNLSADTWTNMYPSRNPAYRTSAAMAYDSRNGVCVLHGGSSDYKNDTWTYDYDANAWTDMNAYPAPCLRYGIAMTYDEAAGAMVLFGGQDINGIPLNDTWLYNYSSNTWTRKDTVQSPVAWVGHEMAYESSTCSVVYFGLSYSEMGYGFPATWSYNAGTNTWTNRTPSAIPPWRDWPAMTYSSAADRIILFGGNINPNRFDDTWTYNTTANSWVRMTPNPGLLYGAGMVFDSTNGVSVHFGGSLNYMDQLRNDTYIYNLRDRSWTNMHPPRSPTARIVPGMAYDSRDGVTILFGGFDGTARDDTWAYNLSKNTWKQMSPPSAPPARFEPAMAYDSENGVVVMYGNVDGALGMNDTWTYNYTADTWTQMHPATVPTTQGSYEGTSLVYDSAAKLMILYLGQDTQYGGLNETWTYNVSSNTWTNVTGPVAPPTCSCPHIVYDAALGLTLLYVGIFSTNETETWAFNSSANAWKRLFPGANLGRRGAPLMVYDSVHDAVLSVGAPYDQSTYDAWAYDLKQYYSPGNLTSEARDLGWIAAFGSISWDASTSPNATLGFQLRTGGTAENINTSQFVGPDGTNATYYNQSGQNISGIHWWASWIQYRAFLCTTNPAETPVLRSVTITYNRLHNNLKILSPAGGENWTGVQNISWFVSDPDNDTLFIDIYLLNYTGSRTTLATNISATAGSWQWNTSSTPDGSYYLRMVFRDDDESIPLSLEQPSKDFTIFHPIPNRLPTTMLLYPADDATINTTDVTLEWTGSDDDGDPLNYTVYIAYVAFGAGNLPEMYSYKEENTSEVNGLEDGMTYFWTVVAFDGKDNGTVPEIRRFTVDLPPVPVNHPPSIDLLRPADNATLGCATVELSWNASDDDNDSLTYVLAWCAGPFASGTPVCVTTDGPSKTLTGLTDGTIYYWMVTASDGKDNTTSGVRRFSVALPVPNRPPRIFSLPEMNATVNVTYYYNVTASDPDNDTLTYENVTSPAGMELNGTTGKLQWTPLQNGTFRVVVRVSDGKGGSDEQAFNVTVRDAPVVKPQCRISTSVSGPVGKRLTVDGTVTPGSRPIVAVEVSIDGRPWYGASWKESWSITIDTTKLKNGMHTVVVRAFDGAYYSDEASLDFEVRNAALPPPEAGFPWWMLAVVAVIAAAIGAAAMLAQRKKAGTAPAEGTPEPAGGQEPLPPEAEDIAIKPGKDAAPAAAIASLAAEPAEAPAAPPAPAQRVAPAGFAVEDMYLMYEDGRLIQHNTRRIKADMDADLMASMLTAVKAFIKDSVGMAEGTELGAMEYGDNKILLQKGRYVVLAAVITGAEPADFRDEMKHAVSNIEGEFGPVLASWDGMAQRLAGAKRFLGQLGEYRVRELPAAPAGGLLEVSLKSELEFYQGFVRLKVAVKNSMDTYMNDASFRLIYKDAVLRLDHIEPNYTVKGDEVVLGNIEPREKRTVAFYLDPQICTESFLEGILSYKDSRGNLEMLKLPRKVASVVCPIVYTDENINTAMLKRMAADELDRKDTKVFAIPPSLPPETAFDLAEAAVQHHDLRLVREFTEKEPFVGEAWYYGKAKGRDDKLVVRARVLGEKRVLEFFVASGSTLMLTGMLAELKADLNQELEAQKGRPEMKQLTAPEEVDAVAMVRTLLDKAAESDLAAGDTDIVK